MRKIIVAAIMMTLITLLSAAEDQNRQMMYQCICILKSGVTNESYNPAKKIVSSWEKSKEAAFNDAEAKYCAHLNLHPDENDGPWSDDYAVSYKSKNRSSKLADSSTRQSYAALFLVDYVTSSGKKGVVRVSILIKTPEDADIRSKLIKASEKVTGLKISSISYELESFDGAYFRDSIREDLEIYVGKPQCPKCGSLEKGYSNKLKKWFCQGSDCDYVFTKAEAAQIISSSKSVVAVESRKGKIEEEEVEEDDSGLSWVKIIVVAKVSGISEEFRLRINLKYGSEELAEQAAAKLDKKKYEKWAREKAKVSANTSVTIRYEFESGFVDIGK